MNIESTPSTSNTTSNVTSHGRRSRSNLQLSGSGHAKRSRDYLLIFAVFFILHVAVILNLVALGMPRWSYRITVYEIDNSGGNPWNPPWDTHYSFGPGSYNVTITEYQGLWETCYNRHYCFSIYQNTAAPIWFRCTQCLYVAGSVMAVVALALQYWLFLANKWNYSHKSQLPMAILSLLNINISWEYSMRGPTHPS